MVFWLIQWGELQKQAQPIAPPQIMVERVIDGDTIVVAGGDRVRLACIDAPELRQPGGLLAKSTLAGWIQGKSVAVIPNGVDRYGRVIGSVIRSGRSVNLAMVGTGMAWQYDRYQDGCDRAALGEAEDYARANRLGLWSLPNPCPPWRWRAGRCAAMNIPAERLGARICGDIGLVEIRDSLSVTPLIEEVVKVAPDCRGCRNQSAQ